MTLDNAPQIEPVDYRRYAILYVDDEEKSLKYFRHAFEDSFEIFTAPDAIRGFELLQTNRDKIGVLMTDQRMPGETGVRLLERARQLDPRILRILVTAYSDVETAIDSVNNGAVFHYLTKPWDPELLESMLRRCLEYFTVQVQRDRLLHEKLAVVQNMLRGDRAESMSILAAGLNHHMRNALTSIKTFVDMVPFKLRQELPTSEHFQDTDFWSSYHGQAVGQVDRLISILERLWDSSCEKELQFEDDVNASEIIAKTIEMMRVEFDQRGLELHANLQDDLPHMTTSPVKLGQLVRLLLQDALVNLSPGHQVVVGFESHEDSDPDAPPMMHLWIADNSPPISEASLPHLFDPFFQRGNNPHDLGTNLMACYHIVHLHGGTIEARNDFDGHTAIHVMLPRWPQHRSEISQQDLASKIAATEATWERMQRPS